MSFQDYIKNRHSFVCSFIQKAFIEYLLDDKNYARAWDFKDVSYKLFLLLGILAKGETDIPKNICPKILGVYVQERRIKFSWENGRRFC